MNGKKLILLSLVLTIPLAVVVRGATAPADPGPTPRMGEERAELTPMHQEIRQADDDTRLQLAAIHERLKTTVPGPEYLELQREIEAIKRESQIRVFDIQLRHAQEAGRPDDAAHLAQALRLLVEGPTVVPAPVQLGVRPVRPPRVDVVTPN